MQTMEGPNEDVERRVRKGTKETKKTRVSRKTTPSALSIIPVQEVLYSAIAQHSLLEAPLTFLT